jgi:L-seryl-tRNA(Ser) seleniumtransferase
MPVEDIERRANLWSQALGGAARVIPGETMVGGGSLPGGSLPTRLVAIGGGKNNTAQNIGRRLRLRDVPVIGRIEKDVMLLDPRTVLPEEDDIMIKALRDISGLLQ